MRHICWAPSLGQTHADGVPSDEIYPVNAAIAFVGAMEFRNTEFPIASGKEELEVKVYQPRMQRIFTVRVSGDPLPHYNGKLLGEPNPASFQQMDG